LTTEEEEEEEEEEPALFPATDTEPESETRMDAG
jgi:hypothetical protein